MTTPNTAIFVSHISDEVDLPATYSSTLGFLNGFVLPDIRSPSPHMSQFRDKTYYQNNQGGNCNNGNCPNDCNCGNKNCANCVIVGGVNCVNCQDRAWLQGNCNCACAYNCATGTVTVNCDCACNCSKRVCAAAYSVGKIPTNIWVADEAYGRHLYKYDRPAYRGYMRWARIVAGWIEKSESAPTFLFWIRNPEARIEAQHAAIMPMVDKILVPWSLHMAYIMGAVYEDNVKGKALMRIGSSICRLMDKVPRVTNPRYRHALPSLYLIWAILYVCDWYGKAAVVKSKFKNFIKRVAYA